VTTFLLSAGGLIWQIVKDRKQIPAQNRKADAEADEAQQSALKSAVETSQLSITQSSALTREVVKLTRENTILSKRVGDMEFRLSILEMEKKDYQALIEDLEEWIKRLCQQVIDLGGNPVTRRKRETI
jgi:DNA repair ATPase RecN